MADGAEEGDCEEAEAYREAEDNKEGGEHVLVKEERG